MFYKMIVKKALKRSHDLDYKPGLVPRNPISNQDSLISLLIHDIFGGEILKTHKKKGWHFYNRIDGERIDFTKSGRDKSFENIDFEDIPSTPDETKSYFSKEDYLTFLIRFVRTFEEAIGLDKFEPAKTA
jgi:hypothetical protein